MWGNECFRREYVTKNDAFKKENSLLIISTTYRKRGG